MNISRWLPFGLVMVLGLCATPFALGRERVIGPHRFTFPDDLELELVTTPDLIKRPIEADFDEDGRLYVTESSGSNEKVAVQLEKKPHRVVRLEDSTGQGRFDRAVEFARDLMFPEGALWQEGSLYVAAPPSIWKLTDTNGDGQADRREEWFKGETLTGCANDLHGPYAGPDGFIYWAKGAFAEQEIPRFGKPPSRDKASHIFRARPDRSGRESVMAGGMDNPVGVTFTDEGEVIFTCTFITHPAGGERDALVHAVYGGVFGKAHDVVETIPRTGPLLPAMTHLGPAAPAGLTRLQGVGLNPNWRGQLISAQFNLHRVQRHQLIVHHSSYRTEDFDLLTSDNPDFHPTDVIEDADGSLLVIDTGGWYKLCCPTSQLAKPEVLGGIYRLRRRAAEPLEDPRGLKLDWRHPTPTELVTRLNDARPAVRDRAMRALGNGGTNSLNAIGEGLARRPTAAVELALLQALSRVDAPGARALNRDVLDRRGPLPPVYSLYAAGLWRDAGAIERLETLLAETGHVGRAACVALGRIGAARAVPALLDAGANGAFHGDLWRRHAATWALMEIGDVEATRPGLSSTNPMVRAVALMAVDQISAGTLRPQEVWQLLSDPSPDLQETALWVATRHPEWAGTLATRLEADWSRADAALANRYRPIIAAFIAHPRVQALLGTTLQGTNEAPARRLLALELMERAPMRDLPEVWIPGLLRALRSDNTDERVGALTVARRFRSQLPAKVRQAVAEMASRSTAAADERFAAFEVLGEGQSVWNTNQFQFLLAQLSPNQPAMRRSGAATLLGRSRLGSEQQVALLDVLRTSGPLEWTRAFPGVRGVTNAAVAEAVVQALGRAPAVKQLRRDFLETVITHLPAPWKEQAGRSVTERSSSSEVDRQRLELIAKQMPKGDVARGHRIFNSPQTACISCHAMGYVGGKVGPDLSRIGQIRTERDLLEAILYPSASFVRSYEPIVVETREGHEVSGILQRETDDELAIVSGASTVERVSRALVKEVRPGTTSVMPQGLTEHLDSQGLADLIAFLKAAR